MDGRGWVGRVLRERETRVVGIRGVEKGCLLVVDAPRVGQGPSGRASYGVMVAFARFADVFGSRLVAAFDPIPADRYDYRPTAPQQSIVFIAQHLEDANHESCESFGALEHRGSAKDSTADSLKARWPKDTLAARLRASLRFCQADLDSAGPPLTPSLANFLLAFETDLAEHHSQLATCMRMLGMVPPSALAPRQRVTVTVSRASLMPLIGVYQVAPGVDLHVTTQDAAFFIRSTTGRDPLHLWSESDTDCFVKEADAQVTFTRTTDGTVSGLVLHQSGRDRTARKTRQRRSARAMPVREPVLRATSTRTRARGTLAPCTRPLSATKITARHDCRAGSLGPHREFRCQPSLGAFSPC